MPWLFELQRGVGKCIEQIYRGAGFQVKYSFVADRTTNPLVRVVFDIFVQPTPTVKLRQVLGGRYQEILASQLALGAENLPVYAVSRESLRFDSANRHSSDSSFDRDTEVFKTPTTDDFFQRLKEDGTVEDADEELRVNQIVPIGAVPAGFFLLTERVFTNTGKG